MPARKDHRGLDRRRGIVALDAPGNSLPEHLGKDATAPRGPKAVARSLASGFRVRTAREPVDNLLLPGFCLLIPMRIH